MTDAGPRTVTSAGRVAWADTDASGWIHFTAPMRWAEEAEHVLYRSLVPAHAPSAMPRKAVSTTYERVLRAGEDSRWS